MKSNFIIIIFALIQLLLVGCDFSRKKNLYARQEDPIAVAIGKIRYTEADVGALFEPSRNPVPLTPEEEFIISRASASVPFLIDALEVESNPIIVAGIANCLNRIETLDGESAARLALSRIKKIQLGENNYYEVNVARKLLNEYLELRHRQRERGNGIKH